MKRVVTFIAALLLLAACAGPAASSPANGQSGISVLPDASQGPSDAPQSEADKPEAPQPLDTGKPGASLQVTLTIPDGVYTLGSTIPAVLSNQSDTPVYFGLPYTVEGLVDGVWTPLQWSEGQQRMWTLIAMILNPGEQADVSFPIEKGEFTPEPAPGTYRLVKQVTAESASQSGQAAESMTLTAEFTLG